MSFKPYFLVIPAAGFGTRMSDIAPGLPKELLPIGKKPAIQYTVEEGLSAGITNIVIIIRKGKESIRRYFEDVTFVRESFPDASGLMENVLNKSTITFCYQKEPLGESDAISYARNIVENRSMAVMYPDNIHFPAPGALLALKKVFGSYGQDVSALMEVNEHNAASISNAGRVNVSPLEGNVFRIERILPKGKGYFIPRFKGELRTCGISIVGPHLFDYIERARHLVAGGEFTDVPVRDLMLAERTILGCRVPGIVFDIGNPEGYELCLKHLINKGGSLSC